jgi:hypothetical protein
MQQIVERTKQILALAGDLKCPTCDHPLYGSAGSENEEGVFTKWVCVNEHCNLYLEEQ